MVFLWRSAIFSDWVTAVTACLTAPVIPVLDIVKRSGEFVVRVEFAETMRRGEELGRDASCRSEGYIRIRGSMRMNGKAGGSHRGCGRRR